MTKEEFINKHWHNRPDPTDEFLVDLEKLLNTPNDEDVFNKAMDVPHILRGVGFIQGAQWARDQRNK